MLYFIPAWYQKNTWKELEQSWHTRRMHTEFDDTVKQVQMFHRSGHHNFKILLLSHTPNFRHFLHRQGVFHVNYWSCFDAIQEVRTHKAAVFSFHNLVWPDGIEFVYTPFVVIGYLNNEKYAQIEFGEAGNPIEVSLYNKGLIARRNIYDDRGFVSAMEVYSEGQIVYTDYLTEKGVAKMREYKEDGRVEINPNTNTFLVSNKDEIKEDTFSQLEYRNLGEVIREVLYAHLLANDGDDIFCIAMHPQNVYATKELIGIRKCILSFYGDRYRIKDHPEGKELVKQGGYLITDSEATSRYLKREIGEELKNLIDISPYDSRMDFGISGELMVQKILVPVDDLPEERFKALMIQLASYLPQNESAMIHIFTRNAEYNLPDRLLEKIANILEEAGFDRRMVIPEEVDETAENDLEDEEEDKEEIPVRFFVEQCVDELSVSKCIREQRIMIDMRHNPDLYLQINCISSAIPQIIRRETQYMQNMYNGFVVTEFDHIPAALDYFLGSLANWNQAKVYSYEIAQRFTTRKLMEKWDMVRAELEK